MKSIFGDTRLDRLEALLCERMVARCSTVIRQFSQNYNEEFSFGRFLRNAKVTPTKIGSSSKGVDGMIEIVEPDKSFGKEVVVFEFSGKTEGFSNKPGDTTS